VNLRVMGRPLENPEHLLFRHRSSGLLVLSRA
jgi:hypothetical protein